MLDCSALVRMREDGEIMVGHATWRNFAAMLRHYKYYDFHYSLGEVRVSFSASPGRRGSEVRARLHQLDITEALEMPRVFDEKLYKACVPESVPSFIVAIFRLSHAALAAEQQAGADPAGVGGDVLAVEQRHLQQPGSFSA